MSFLPLWQDDKLSGIYAVDLKVRAECEDPEEVKSIEQGEDPLIQQCIKKDILPNSFTSKIFTYDQKKTQPVIIEEENITGRQLKEDFSKQL